MRDRSGLKAAERTGLPVAAEDGDRLAGRGVPDPRVCIDAVTMRDPSGLKAAERTGLLVAVEDGDRVAGRGVPDPRGACLRRGDDAFSVGTEDGGTDQCRRGR